MLFRSTTDVREADDNLYMAALNLEHVDERRGRQHAPSTWSTGTSRREPARVSKSERHTANRASANLTSAIGRRTDQRQTLAAAVPAISGRNLLSSPAWPLDRSASRRLSTDGMVDSPYKSKMDLVTAASSGERFSMAEGLQYSNHHSIIGLPCFFCCSKTKVRRCCRSGET